MLYKDNIFIGVILAIVFIAGSFVVLTNLSDMLMGIKILGFPFRGFSEEFIAVMSVCSCTIPAGVYYKRHLDRSLQGVGTVAILCAIGVTYYFFIYI